MSYINESLSSGESVLYQTRLHWIVMLAPSIGAVFFAIAGLGLLIGAFSTRGNQKTDFGTLVGVGIALLVVAAIFLASAYWKRAGTEMAVTNKRVLVKTGILTRRSIEIMLAKIESIVVDQTVAGRMFNFGTIIVRGTGGTPETFNRIAHPLEFRRNVQEQIDKLPETRPAMSGA